MRKNSKYFSISEYCKANSLKPTKFYETLSRHPELAKKLKTNAKGERVIDEKAITAAGAILRKENRAKQGRSSAYSAADEIRTCLHKHMRTSFRQILPQTALKILAGRKPACGFLPTLQQNYARKSAHISCEDRS